MATLRSRCSGRAALLLSLLLAILGAKLLLIDRYGSDLPYWDQWDAEGDFLFRPYLEGRLTAADLFRAHNEHRPFFTRSLALALLEAGGRQWDPRVQLVVNAALHAGAALLLLGAAWRALPPLAAAGFAGICALFFSTSVSWENTLSGFQSQFYLVLLFTALHLGATLLARPRSWRWWIAPLAGLAALFSMASGLLSALAILGATAARALRDRRLTRDDLYVFGTNAVLVVAGWLLKADVPGHAVLKAASVGPWLDAFLHQFSWPVISLWAAPLGLLPPAALALAYFRRRIDGPVALTLLGASTWFCLQAAAIAYARGAETHGYASRYCDTLSVGVLTSLLALAYLAATAPTARARRGWIAMVAIFAGTSLWGLSREAATTQKNTLNSMPGINAARIACVRDYLASHTPEFFKKAPWDELPYPSAERLAGLLDSPALKNVLPESVRSPLPMTADDGQTRGFSPSNEKLPAGLTAPGMAGWMSAAGTEARFVSVPFQVDHSRLSVLVAGDGAGKTTLQLIEGAGRAIEPLGRLEPLPRWKRLNFNVVPGTYRLEASHTGTGWFAFTAPKSNTRLSVLALKIVQLGPWLLGASAALGVAALVLLWPATRSTKSSSHSHWLGPATTAVFGLAVGAVLAVRLGLVAHSPSPPPLPPEMAKKASPDFGLRDPTTPGRVDGKFTGAVFPPGRADRKWHGTYVGGDVFTGRVISTSFILTEDILQVPILGYPGSPGNGLSLEILDEAETPTAAVHYRGPNPRERPDQWAVRVGQWRSRKARLVLTDGQTTPSGWLAVATPVNSTGHGLVWLDGVPRNPGWIGISAFALTGLLFLPGLACRSWWRGRFPSSTAFLALPGLVVLAAGQWSIALGVPADTELAAQIGLAGYVVLAGTLTLRWSRHGNSLTKSEFFQLGVYGCIAIGVFVLTLPF